MCDRTTGPGLYSHPAAASCSNRPPGPAALRRPGKRQSCQPPTQPRHIKTPTVQPPVQRAMPAPMLRRQRQFDQRLHRAVRTQQGVTQLEQGRRAAGSGRHRTPTGSMTVRQTHPAGLPAAVPECQACTETPRGQAPGRRARPGPRRARATGPAAHPEPTTAGPALVRCGDVHSGQYRFRRDVPQPLVDGEDDPAVRGVGLDLAGECERGLELWADADPAADLFGEPLVARDTVLGEGVELGLEFRSEGRAPGVSDADVGGLDVRGEVSVCDVAVPSPVTGSCRRVRSGRRRCARSRSCVDHVSRLGRSGRSQTPACQWIILRLFILTSCDCTKSVHYGSH